VRTVEAVVLGYANGQLNLFLVLFFLVFLAFPLFLGLFFFLASVCLGFGCLSWVLGLFDSFLGGLFGVYGGSWWVGVFSDLVWVFNLGLHCILGFGFLVRFARAELVLRHLFLVYFVCIRSDLC
jgi:hypothetical protein